MGKTTRDKAKLNLGDQRWEFPVYVGTEGNRAIDISRLFAETGHITLDEGYANTGSTTSAITFVDGERSITEIWRLVRAEVGNVTTSSHEWKYAYVITPETPDIGLDVVAVYIEAMERAGLVEILRQ